MSVLRASLDLGALIARGIMWCLRRIVLLCVIAAVSLAVSLVTVTVPAAFNAVSSLAEAVTDAVRPKSPATTARQRTAVTLADADVALGVARGEADMLRTQMATLDEQSNALRTRLDAMVSEVDDLKRQANVTYRGRSIAVKDAVANTTERLTDRIRNATARNIATMPGEALPIFGIAVVAGATAWEVKDACDMMTDLHALDLAFNPDHAIAEREVCGAQVPTAQELWTTIKASPQDVWQRTTTQVADLPDVDWGAPYQRVVRVVTSIGDLMFSDTQQIAVE